VKNVRPSTIQARKLGENPDALFLFNLVNEISNTASKSVYIDAFEASNDPRGLYFAGLWWEKENKNKTLSCLKRACEGGLSWAEAAYGYKTKDKALVAKATESNCAIGWYWLGVLEEDDQRARAHYLKSAELGWEDGMVSVAEMYRKGRGIFVIISIVFYSFFW
jgi:TPR repeat protein